MLGKDKRSEEMSFYLQFRANGQTSNKSNSQLVVSGCCFVVKVCCLSVYLSQTLYKFWKETKAKPSVFIKAPAQNIIKKKIIFKISLLRPTIPTLKVLYFLMFLYSIYFSISIEAFIFLHSHHFIIIYHYEPLTVPLALDIQAFSVVFFFHCYK